MKRLALMIAVLVAACGDGGRDDVDAPTHDMSIDAAGSGSAAAFVMEPSPRDHNLDVMVVALGVVIAAGPIGASRRRRPDPL